MAKLPKSAKYIQGIPNAIVIDPRPLRIIKGRSTATTPVSQKTKR
jgi:hypothetical protein